MDPDHRVIKGGDCILHCSCLYTSYKRIGYVIIILNHILLSLRVDIVHPKAKDCIIHGRLGLTTTYSTMTSVMWALLYKICQYYWHADYTNVLECNLKHIHEHVLPPFDGTMDDMLSILWITKFPVWNSLFTSGWTWFRFPMVTFR